MPTLFLSSAPASACPAPGLSLPRLWLNRVLKRRALAVLHPDQIRDAGLDPWVVRAEIRKPFWRA